MFEKLLPGLGVMTLAAVAAVSWAPPLSGDTESGRPRFVDRTLRAGDIAPTVDLYDLDGGEPRRLEQWFGDRPLVLIFGSFT